MNLNRNVLLIVGAVVIGINTFGLAYVLMQQDNSATAKADNTPAVVASTVFPTNSYYTKSFDIIDNKVLHLSNEVLMAKDEISTLKEALTIVNNKLKEQRYADTIDKQPQLTQAEMRHQQAEAKQQYVSSLQSAPRNEAWASQMEDEMLSSIETAQLNGFGHQGVNVQGIECYSENCLIDVTLSDSDNESLILAMLPWAVTAEFIPSEDDALTGRMVITKI